MFTAGLVPGKTSAAGLCVPAASFGLPPSIPTMSKTSSCVTPPFATVTVRYPLPSAEARFVLKLMSYSTPSILILATPLGLPGHPHLSL